MNELFQWIVNLLKDARFWQIVLPWERGVRVRFGRWVKVWEAGLHLRIPFFDDVRVVNTRLMVATVPSLTVTTLDGRVVTLAANIGLRIADPVKVLMAFRDPTNVCSAFAQGEFQSFIASRTLEDCKPAVVERAVSVALTAFGKEAIEFVFVRLVDFAVCRTIRLINDNWRPNSGHGESL